MFELAEGREGCFRRTLIHSFSQQLLYALSSVSTLQATWDIKKMCPCRNVHFSWVNTMSETVVFTLEIMRWSVSGMI